LTYFEFLQILNFEFGIIRRFDEASAPEAGMRAVPRLCIILGPGICRTSEEKSRENLSQGTRKVLGHSVPNTIRLIDLVTFKRWPQPACWPPPPLA
jgi:hypothetical protein